MPQSALKSHLSNLEDHQKRLASVPTKDLFFADKNRMDRFSIQSNKLYFDFSKNHIDIEVLDLLVGIAQNAGVESARDKMFAGEKINLTENRAVLHTALRAEDTRPLLVGGIDIVPEISETKARAFAFANQLRDGKYRLDNKKVTDVVNIGIGGSNLGPAMSATALSPYHDGPNTHFVSNVDGADFYDTTKHLNPKTTLFIVASKSFTTAETMANAQLAKKWLAESVDSKNIGDHFVALSTNIKAATAFGVTKESIFGFWDWVGGRYSIWSSIGLSLMIAIGSEKYQDFLDGAAAADRHFQNEKLAKNIPVLMAMIGIWHRNICNYPTHAILPYDNRLLSFPAYLQQLDMESNGKHVCRDGTDSQFLTGPVIWGEPGTDGQHAFFQLMHQGTDIIPCDFLIAAKSHEDDQAHQQMLVANCFAQSEAMMAGRSLSQVKELMRGQNYTNAQISRLAPHKKFEGNRPSNTFLYEKLTPFMLGHLIALFEHKIFVQGVIWGINSFDQWGVELGKQLANELQPFVSSSQNDNSAASFSGSSRGLLKKFKEFQNKLK